MALLVQAERRSFWTGYYAVILETTVDLQSYALNGGGENNLQIQAFFAAFCRYFTPPPPGEGGSTTTSMAYLSPAITSHAPLFLNRSLGPTTLLCEH